jgi:hypothetical protein
MTGALKLESVVAAIGSEFPCEVGEPNAAAAEAACELVAHQDIRVEANVEAN